MTSQLPAIPPGPADTIHPRRALVRLALSYAYYEAADLAAGGVPTVSDEYGDPYDYVDHAARLVAMAQDVWTVRWSMPASVAAGGTTSPRL